VSLRAGSSTVLQEPDKSSYTARVGRRRAYREEGFADPGGGTGLVAPASHATMPRRLLLSLERSFSRINSNRYTTDDNETGYNSCSAVIPLLRERGREGWVQRARQPYSLTPCTTNRAGLQPWDTPRNTLHYPHPHPILAASRCVGVTTVRIRWRKMKFCLRYESSPKFHKSKVSKLHFKENYHQDPIFRLSDSDVGRAFLCALAKLLTLQHGLVHDDKHSVRGAGSLGGAWSPLEPRPRSRG
jgi:hypothetical protein